MLSTSFSKKIIIVCALACATQGTYAKDDSAVVAILAPNTSSYIDKKTVAVAAAGVFLLCSWRLFQKKAPEGEPKYTVNDVLKVWNILSSDYWSAFDEQVIGTPDKAGDDVTTITYNEETDAIEMRVTKEKKRSATGLFGFYIYKSLLKPLKKISDLIKPVLEIATNTEKIINHNIFK
jgi:hypothetical protein